MKNILSRSLLLLLLILMVQRVNAQQGSVTISGKITSAEDKQPIHAVTVSIDRKGVGTSTNLGGSFLLIIPAANIRDTLKVSCIGFKTRQLPIADLKNGEELNIVLQKNSTQLKEVSIEYHDALKIIQKAIRRIPENYMDHPHVLRGFYRMYTFDGDNPLQLSEAVFDVYNFGYSDKHADMFRLIKARNEKNQRDFSMLELGQKPNSVFEYDIVNHIFASGLLNEDGLQKHEFEVKGIVDVKGYEAYQIEFKEKPGVEDRTFRGRMFVDTKTYAFIYFDFGLSPSGLTDYGLSKFMEHSLLRTGTAQVEFKKDHTEVSYQEVGHRWVLADVKGDDVLAIKNSESKKDFTAHIKFNYQVTAVDTAKDISFSSKLGRNENINNYNSSSGEKFWKDYNILLSDFNAEDVFKQIQEINKLKGK
jgi:hypothetical protein